MFYILIPLIIIDKLSACDVCILDHFGFKYTGMSGLHDLFSYLLQWLIYTDSIHTCVICLHDPRFFCFKPCIDTIGIITFLSQIIQIGSMDIYHLIEHLIQIVSQAICTTVIPCEYNSQSNHYDYIDDDNHYQGRKQIHHDFLIK